MLSARQLLISWGDTAEYWTWHPLPDSRFSEVAELKNVCWLEIRGKIESSVLTPKTTYAAYFIFKVDQNSGGLSYPNQETTVKLGAQVSKHTVNVQPRGSCRFGYRRLQIFPGWRAMLEGNNTEPRAPQARADGWMEMEMGEFYNDEGGDGEVEMSLTEVKGGNWKTGLIIQGIEIRPNK